LTIFNVTTTCTSRDVNEAKRRPFKL